jgi:hypothetical protein
MMKWHDSWFVRLLLRLGGAALLYVAYETGMHLIAFGHAAHTGDQPAIAYLLALIAFCSFSLGGAFLVHGHHLFDKVRVSKHWMRLDSQDESAGDHDESAEYYGINR